jgi:hypothetical protein
MLRADLPSRSVGAHSGSRKREIAAKRKRIAAPLVVQLESWVRIECARLSRHSDAAKAIDYMLER